MKHHVVLLGVGALEHHVVLRWVYVVPWGTCSYCDKYDLALGRAWLSPQRAQSYEKLEDEASVSTDTVGIGVRGTSVVHANTQAQVAVLSGEA